MINTVEIPVTLLPGPRRRHDRTRRREWYDPDGAAAPDGSPGARGPSSSVVAGADHCQWGSVDLHAPRLADRHDLQTTLGGWRQYVTGPATACSTTVRARAVPERRGSFPPTRRIRATTADRGSSGSARASRQAVSTSSTTRPGSSSDGVDRRHPSSATDRRRRRSMEVDGAPASGSRRGSRARHAPARAAGRGAGPPGARARRPPRSAPPASSRSSPTRRSPWRPAGSRRRRLGVRDLERRQLGRRRMP